MTCRAFVSMLAAASLTAIAFSIGCDSRSSAQSGAGRATPGPTRTVSAAGRIEPSDGVLQIVGPMGERIQKVKVEVGDVVKSGEELIEIEVPRTLQAQRELAISKLQQTRELLEAEKAHADALLKETEERIAHAEQLSAIRVEGAQAEVDALDVQFRQADKEFQQRKQLTPPADHDRLRQPVERLESQLRAAQAALKSAQKDQEFQVQEATNKVASIRAGLEKSERAIDVDVVQKNVDAAQAAIDRLTILSPIDGEVLQVFGHSGQTIDQRPILTLAATNAMVVVAEVHEADIARVRKGQTATIRSAALSKELSGTVESVGRVVQRNQVFGLDPTARTDARVLEVRILLVDPQEARDRIGLQVDVTIDTAAVESSPVPP